MTVKCSNSWGRVLLTNLAKWILIERTNEALYTTTCFSGFQATYFLVLLAATDMYQYLSYYKKFTTTLRNKARVFLFFVLQIFLQQVRVGGRNKNKNKIHSDHFPIELKSKETRFVFPSILIQLENDPNEFYF